MSMSSYIIFPMYKHLAICRLAYFSFSAGASSLSKVLNYTKNYNNTWIKSVLVSQFTNNYFLDQIQIYVQQLNIFVSACHLNSFKYLQHKKGEHLGGEAILNGTKYQNFNRFEIMGWKYRMFNKSSQISHTLPLKMIKARWEARIKRDDKLTSINIATSAAS